jgi:hypothetical protein
MRIFQNGNTAFSAHLRASKSQHDKNSELSLFWFHKKSRIYEEAEKGCQFFAKSYQEFFYVGANESYLSQSLETT